MRSSIFVLIALLQFGEILCVCNITALSSVDAITLNKDGKAEKHYNVNFNLMDGYKVIYVTKANATVLCEGIIKFFSRLEELNIIGANITSIERKAFQHVPRLTKLSLAVNNLTEFNAGHVNEIKTLKVFYLTSNQLHHIDHDAFDNMVNLTRLYLNRNKLTIVNGLWFKNCPNLQLIDLSHNLITSIPPKAFAHLQPSIYNQLVQYKLSYNQITSISEEAIDSNKEYLILRLDSNRLRDIPLSVYQNLMQINSLVLNTNRIDCLDKEVLQILKTTTISFHVVNNPIQCSCLQEFDRFVEENAIQAAFYYNSTFNCALLKQIPIFVE